MGLSQRHARTDTGKCHTDLVSHCHSMRLVFNACNRHMPSKHVWWDKIQVYHVLMLESEMKLKKIGPQKAP